MTSKIKNIIPLYRFVALSFLSTLLVTGCEPSRHASQQIEVPATMAPAPGDVKIVCGQGGGFTGAWSGYTIFGGGTIQSWKGAYAEDQMVAEGTVPADSLAMLWHKLEQMDFFSLQLEEYANMTAMVLVEANNQSHRVSWPPKVEGFEPLETPLDSFYVHCLSLSKAVLDQ